MGYTLRAVLDTLPATAQVVVAELNPVVLQWCRGPLARLTDSAVNDPRVAVEIADVAHVIRRSRGAERKKGSMPSSLISIKGHIIVPINVTIPSMAARQLTIRARPSSPMVYLPYGAKTTMLDSTSGSGRVGFQ